MNKVRPSFLAWVVAVFLLSSSLSAQTTIYVDSLSPATGAGDGATQATAYRSLTYAVSRFANGYNGTAPATIWVAGRGPSVPYQNNSSLPVNETETFPIVVGQNVQLLYWDPYSVVPPAQPLPAVFKPGTQSLGGTTACFDFSHTDGGLINEGIAGYMTTATLLTDPDTNQGFKIREFPLGIKVVDGLLTGFGGFNLNFDGVFFIECQQALFVRAGNELVNTLDISRTLMRTADTAFTPSLPLVDVMFDGRGVGGNRRLDFTMTSADLRPGNSGMQSSMMVFQGKDCWVGDTLNIDLGNILITGEPVLGSVNGGPPTQQYIDGAGIEVGLKQSCRGVINLDNVEIRDAKGDGFLGYVSTELAEAFQSLTGCNFHNNGGATFGTPAINSGMGAFANFSNSGMHLIVFERGEWSVADARESHFSKNYRHGAFLEAQSLDDENDGFPIAEFDLCTFCENGLSGITERAHGLYTKMVSSTIDMKVHRSALSTNRSCGIRMEFEGTETKRHHQLDVTNSTISQNTGAGAMIYGTGGLLVDSAPVSIDSLDGDNVLETHLSQVTISANPSPYAFTLYGHTTLAQDHLWPVGSQSSVDNSVLNANSAFSSDQAFYPEPPSAQWSRMFTRTWYSNLGNIKAGSSIPAYTTANSNFYGAPGLTAFTLGGYAVGNVFPPLGSLVVNKGTIGSNRYATETTDNRGHVSNPRFIAPKYDVGAYEVD